MGVRRLGLPCTGPPRRLSQDSRHVTLLRPAPPASLSQATMVSSRIVEGPATLIASPGTSSTAFPRNTAPRPHPSTTSCTWKPSSGDDVPVLSSTVQSLPLTSTQLSDSTIAEPSNTLPRSTPSLVPSLMSTASAVVPAMSLASTTLRSLRSGSQSVSWHQLLSALPT